MPDTEPPTYSAFIGARLLRAGPLPDVALAVQSAATQAREPILVFADATGAVVDLDLRGTPADLLARLAPPALQDASPVPHPKAGPGRPRLGVVAREVTLLPRHWTWLAEQRGGASNALRRLVEDAMRSDGWRTVARRAQDACYKVSTALAGDRPGYEEAMRALFRNDAAGFLAQTAEWPPDVRAYAARLAGFVTAPDGAAS